jgi:Fe-S-cluster containining protein
LTSEPTTIFQNTVRGLASSLAEAAVDHSAFETPLPVCQLAKCRATCCHDGVILSDEEAEILSGESEGIIRLEDGRFKTETIKASSDHLADDFPDHFPKTRCVFLDEKHRCRWQLRAVQERKHPWFYKPTSCWMHPLILKNEVGRPRLTLLSRDQDRVGFATFTPCGKSEASAPPARESLKMELEMLGAISGRDFYGELNAPPGFSPDANDITSG